MAEDTGDEYGELQRVGTQGSAIVDGGSAGRASSMDARMV
jgi:hypothetical protein